MEGATYDLRGVNLLVYLTVGCVGFSLTTSLGSGAR